MTYDVTARRWARGWELHISDGEDEVGVTQSRTLAGAERMVRDYLELDDRPNARDAAITITPDLGDQGSRWKPVPRAPPYAPRRRRSG